MCVCEQVLRVCVCARFSSWVVPPFSFIAVWFHMAVRLGRSDPRPRAPFVRGLGAVLFITSLSCDAQRRLRGDHGGDLGRNSPDTRDERPCGRGTCKLATISHRANLVPTTMPATEVHESRRLLFSSIRIQAETRRRRGATTHIS